MCKTRAGQFFEDFWLGQELRHATPRTVMQGDSALYLALTGSRYLIHCSTPFAQTCGLPQSPIEDLLAFHIVFGKSVPDISLNAVANLGYADGRFYARVYPGDTLAGSSRVIGLKETSSRQAGIVWVRTEGRKADGTLALDYVRWVMVRKRDAAAEVREAETPELPATVASERLVTPADLVVGRIDPAVTGSPYFLEDYEPGERIDHVDGMSVMDSEHRLATRLYQNTAKVHFNDHVERQGRLGGVIVYGGVVISIARALAFNGLGNMLGILAINAGNHANPCRAGNTVYAWSEVLERVPLPGRSDVGALRLRLVATRDRSCHDFPLKDETGRYLPDVLLDLDYWGLMPTRQTAA